MKKTATTFFQIIFPSITIGLLLYFQYQYLFLDLWRDESFSFLNFALADFKTNMTYYPEPNNHIFFNLFNNVISRIVGVRDFFELFDYVYIFRFAQGLIAFATVYYVYLFAEKFYNLQTAWIATIVLVTTIPFLNFMMQLRGYNMSMFFTITSLYYSYLFLEEQKNKQLYASVVSFFLLMYTLPSNLYFFLTLMIVFAYHWSYSFFENNHLSLKERAYGLKENKSYWTLLWGGAIGLIMTIMAYAPVLERMLNDKYLNKIPDDRFFVLTNRFPDFIMGMISERNLLITTMLVAVLYLFFKSKDDKMLKYWLPLIPLIFLPFLFSLARNDFPQPRTFVIVAPLVALFIAVPISHLIASLKISPQLSNGLVVLIFSYCSAVSLFEWNHNQMKLKENLAKSIRAQGLYQNYFQSTIYNPYEVAKEINDYYQENKFPVILAPKELDSRTLLDYLNKYKIPTYFLNKFDHVGQECNLRLLVPNDVKGRVEFEEKKFISKEKVIKSPSRIKKFTALVDMARKESNVDKFYVVSSYDRHFNTKLTKFYRDDFKIEKLNSTETSFNIYKFQKYESLISFQADK